MTVRGDAKAIHDDLVRLRRDLHRAPEVGLNLPHTQRRVLAELDRLPLEVSTGSALSSVTAVLRGSSGKDRRTVLLRADMDALPIVERTGLQFAATGERMHACGHDLHAAMLVGAARLLAARREVLAGDVVFMFQPGEEGYDGARLMIDAGVLDAAGRRADAAYALHVSTRLPAGVFATRPGTMLAASAVLRATVHGTGGHGGLPHRARDPVPAACEMVTALQTFVTRTFDVFDPVVITVGTFHAGTAHNVIPDAAAFEATVRSFSRKSYRRALSESVRVCRGIAAAYGLELQIEATEECPVTVNNAAEVDLVESVVRAEYGEQCFVRLRNPLAATEDFSRVLEAVPGALISLGACPPDVDPATAPGNHSSNAVFDDSVLADGAALYAHLAMRRVARTNGDGDPTRQRARCPR
jgi:hippurate hydrolase